MALPFVVSTSSAPDLCVKQEAVVPPQVLQAVFSAGKLCQYRREGMVSILPVQSDAKRKDELLRLPRQGLLGAACCKQQHSVVLRKQET